MKDKLIYWYTAIVFTILFYSWLIWIIVPGGGEHKRNCMYYFFTASPQEEQTFLDNLSMVSNDVVEFKTDSTRVDYWWFYYINNFLPEKKAIIDINIGDKRICGYAVKGNNKIFVLLYKYKSMNEKWKFIFDEEASLTVPFEIMSLFEENVLSNLKQIEKNNIHIYCSIYGNFFFSHQWCIYTVFIIIGILIKVCNYSRIGNNED